MKKKSVVALLALCVLCLVAVYVGVNRYIDRVDAKENAKLQEQRDTYAKARAKRIRESKSLLAQDELRVKLGLADHPDTEVRIAEEATQDNTLTGEVEVKSSAGNAAEPEVRKHRFRIEYDDTGEIRSCELLD